MREVFDAYTVIIVLALLIGAAVGFWAFRRRAAAPERPILTETQPTSSAYVTPKPEPAPEPPAQLLGVETPLEVPAVAGPADDLSTMKGVGPKLVARLNELGVSRFDQLAAMNETELAALDERLGAFRGRLQRDRIPEQAALLASGDRATFEERFGKLGGAD